MNPYRSGKLVLFQVTYDRDWHFFEILFFIILGIFGVRAQGVAMPLLLTSYDSAGSLRCFHGEVQHAVRRIPPKVSCGLSRHRGGRIGDSYWNNRLLESFPSDRYDRKHVHLVP